MAKKQERSEVEYLRGLVRELKAECRNLKKSISRLEKRDRDVSDEEEERADPTPALPEVSTVCPDCLAQQTEFVSLGVRTMLVCRACGYRRTQKK